MNDIEIGYAEDAPVAESPLYDHRPVAKSRDFVKIVARPDATATIWVAYDRGGDWFNSDGEWMSIPIEVAMHAWRETNTENRPIRFHVRDMKDLSLLW